MFRWLVSAFEKEGMNIDTLVDKPNTTMFLPMILTNEEKFEKLARKHILEDMSLTVADFDFGTSRVRNLADFSFVLLIFCWALIIIRAQI